MTGTILKPSYIIHHAYGTLMLLCENLWAHRDAAQSFKRDRAEVLFLWFQGDDKQVVRVYTAMKVITPFPVQELGAHEWTLQVFGFQFFLIHAKVYSQKHLFPQKKVCRSVIQLYQVTPLVCYAIYKPRDFHRHENTLQGFNHSHPG